MSISTTVKPAVHAALGSLIDYAGLFPPATLAMAAALEEYRAARPDRFAWMLGRFIVTASQLVASRSELTGLALCVVLDPLPPDHVWFDGVHAILERVAAARDERGVAVETLELSLPATVASREGWGHAMSRLRNAVDLAGLREARIYVELPRTDAWFEHLRPALDAAVNAALGVKLRCGGTIAEAFPNVREVAAFVAAAFASGAPFKATAGLHHPIRHTDEATGFPMHGFLNLLAAAAFAPHASRAVLERIVAEESPRAFRFDESALVWETLEAPTGRLADMRRDQFHAYGSCSFSEPVDDLIALRMLPAA